MRKIMLILSLSLALQACITNNYGHLIVEKVELNKNHNKLRYKYFVQFKAGNGLYTNKLYKVNDTLR